MKAFASLVPILTFLETIIILQLFHPLDLLLPCLDFLMEFQPEIDLDFSLNMFTSTFIHLTHLLVGGPSSMVFEHLQYIFDPKDLASYFSKLFLVRSYIVVPRCIFENITSPWCCQAINFGQAFRWHSSNCNKQGSLSISE